MSHLSRIAALLVSFSFACASSSDAIHDAWLDPCLRDGATLRLDSGARRSDLQNADTAFREADRDLEKTRWELASRVAAPVFLARRTAERAGMAAPSERVLRLKQEIANACLERLTRHSRAEVDAVRTTTEAIRGLLAKSQADLEESYNAETARIVRASSTDAGFSEALQRDRDYVRHTLGEPREQR